MRKRIAFVVILFLLPLFPACDSDTTHSTAEGESARDKPYVASVLRDPYHKSSCSWAAKINEENLVGYDTKAQAESDGHRPCKVCTP